ncbi:polyprenyl synthetase family protein [Argonema antarcticum]|uniref:polyprenyl synthetase family protein n=1 Tax=Argonema antarcticum TaxID=2942763 RepID=UPI002013AA2C|nr:polyprenyl synthetase family protein [Argonema antarcticum]MCL1470877.1 polyprenyl synthetase family protein [Argonema antarcticum A004/B2]
MFAIFLFVVCFCFLVLLVNSSNRETVSQPKELAQQEVIKIFTALPNEQQENQSLLAVEVNIGNSSENKSLSYQQLEQPASSPAFEKNGNKLNGNKINSNKYSENYPTTLPVFAQSINSTPLASQGGVAIASRSNIPTNLLNGETLENHKVGEATNGVQEQLMYDRKIINEAVQECRLAVVKKILEFVETKSNITGSYKPLYDLLIDYPFRSGKMLRPTMCISMARAVGGMGHDALTSASALELYHNAFLIHDDIEDGSESRRGKGTLHQMIGIPRAINVGDATNVLAVGLLLENLSVIGVAKALKVLQEIEFMAQQSVEGQAMELDWVATNTSNLTDQDYFKMCVKKTCWYSFITPCRIGLIVGYPSASDRDLVKELAGISRFGMILGIAFQIQDDLLNLQGQLESYGKEIGGDIYEGKRTLMLNHVLAHSGDQSEKILEILALPREKKTPDQLAFIMDQMQRCGSIEHGWKVARSLANQAAEIFESLDFLQPETPLRLEEKWGCSIHDRRVLKELINYVIYRNV